MPNTYWLGLATIPAVLVGLALVGGAIIGTVRLWHRYTPAHWSISLRPARQAVPAADVFRFVNAGGRHAHTFRRLFGFGPFTLYVIRYRPGNVEGGDLS